MLKLLLFQLNVSYHFISQFEGFKRRYLRGLSHFLALEILFHRLDLFLRWLWRIWKLVSLTISYSKTFEYWWHILEIRLCTTFYSLNSLSLQNIIWWNAEVFAWNLNVEWLWIPTIYLFFCSSLSFVLIDLLSY